MYPIKMSVTVDSRLECAVLAGVLVRTFCIESGVSAVESGQIEVCTMEAANNCVVHAYKGKSGHPVEIVAFRNEGELKIEVRDQGTPMNPEILREGRSHLLSLDPGEVDAAPESGRGLAIIEAIMDQVGYSTVNGTNCLSMTKSVPCESRKI
jgi:serine/threonine-protein kinase RsbW